MRLMKERFTIVVLNGLLATLVCCASTRKSMPAAEMQAQTRNHILEQRETEEVEYTAEKEKRSEPVSAALKTKTSETTASEIAPPVSVEPSFERLTSGLFDTSFSSLSLKDSAWVRVAPFAQAQELGMISRSANPAYRSHVINEDCKTPWIEIAPHGWICVRAKPSKRPPSSKSTGPLRSLPGSYARARRGGRFYASIEAAQAGGEFREAKGDMFKIVASKESGNGRTLHQTELGEWIDTSSTMRLYGSNFKGVALDEISGIRLPIAFAVNRESKKARGAVKVYSQPSREGTILRKMPSKTAFAIDLGSEKDGFYSLEDGGWVHKSDLRIAEKVTVPKGAGGSNWVDVNLENQVVTIYRGEIPVFVTLGSSGHGENATPTGLYRVTRKKKETTMRNDRGLKQTYSASVPWATYFHEGYAFHAAYWHNSFGITRSHGCINLSPPDALRVYSHLGPDLHPGWLAVYGDNAQQLGSVVQVRDGSASQD